MIDIHSHVLPNMDDGAHNVAESIQLLQESARQGITLMAATPHFYADEESPQRFLKRRAVAVEALREEWESSLPRVMLGAEVHYFEGISRAEEMVHMRIGPTQLFLLEMPMGTWSERMVREIEDLQRHPKMQVVLAHIERYEKEQKASTWRQLRDIGVKMQCNADFFLSWKTKRKALRMLRRGEIHFLASDCHNMRSRPPRIEAAMDVIDQSLGRQGRRTLEAEAMPLLETLKVTSRR